jgi:hypothetical protein
MMLRCPNCGAGMSLDALVSHQELRQLLATALRGLPCGDDLLRYLGLFRPAKRELRPERAARLLRDVLADMQRGCITRRGRDWSAPPELWQAALQAVLDAAAKGSLQTPLADHAYLHEVLMRLADKQEAAQEAAHEQQRRSRAPRGAVQVTGQSASAAEALAQDPALAKLAADALAAAPMPEAVRAHLAHLRGRGASAVPASAPGTESEGD